MVIFSFKRLVSVKTSSVPAEIKLGTSHIQDRLTAYITTD